MLEEYRVMGELASSLHTLALSYCHRSDLEERELLLNCFISRYWSDTLQFLDVASVVRKLKERSYDCYNPYIVNPAEDEYDNPECFVYLSDYDDKQILLVSCCDDILIHYNYIEEDGTLHSFLYPAGLDNITSKNVNELGSRYPYIKNYIGAIFDSELVVIDMHGVLNSENKPYHWLYHPKYQLSRPGEPWFVGYPDSFSFNSYLFFLTVIQEINGTLPYKEFDSTL
ncbi:MAG: hypothetical protein GY861_21935 [bacterium]|nr:hypothetical protein [bacterium]